MPLPPAVVNQVEIIYLFRLDIYFERPHILCFDQTAFTSFFKAKDEVWLTRQNVSTLKQETLTQRTGILTTPGPRNTHFLLVMQIQCAYSAMSAFPCVRRIFCEGILGQSC